MMIIENDKGVWHLPDDFFQRKAIIEKRIEAERAKLEKEGVPRIQLESGEFWV